MPSELARKLGKSPSTIVEHLKKLEEHGFVKKVPGGNKWVYYELTPEGRKLIEKKDMRIVIPFTLGILLLITGVFLSGLFSGGQKKYVPATKKGEEKLSAARGPANISTYYSPSVQVTERINTGLLLILAGILVVLYGVKRWATR